MPFKKLTVLIFLISLTCNSQVNEILYEIYLERFDEFDFKRIESLDIDAPLKSAILTHSNYMIFGDIENNEHILNPSKSSFLFDFLKQMNIGHRERIKNGNLYKAFLDYEEAIKIARTNNDTLFYKIALKNLLIVVSNMNDIKKNSAYTGYLNSFTDIASTQTEKEMAIAFELRFKLRSDNLTQSRLSQILQLVNDKEKNKSSMIRPRILSYVGYHHSISGSSRESMKYLHEARKLLSNKKGTENRNRLAATYILLGGTLIDMNELDSAHYYLNKTPIDRLTGYPKRNIESYKYYYKWLAHEKQGNADSTDIFKLKFYEQDFNLKIDKNNHDIQNLTEKYRNESLRKKNRTTLIISISILLIVTLIGVLIQKNTKRKQLLAEQEKELQVQKVGTLMKEQELASIDAMIEGQEKERQRIANDLHDDLGGMMATVKLHFNTLKDKPSPELYEKTDRLLDEAYQKVRTVAHAKNSGVIAKEGLLKSVNDMAQKVSSTGKIAIDVVDHGLENRLENSLELTIFRIIQELITNVIKHAHATEATIHLTQHDNSLNIMVEDNGTGFNSKQITSREGMGLSSIDKRIDHLHGSLEIDSEIGRGTNIIIDIPI